MTFPAAQPSDPAAQPSDPAAQPSDPAAAGDRRERFGLVLGALVIAFAVQGVAEPSAWEQVLVSALLATTLLLAFRAADVRPRGMRWAMVVAGLLLAVSVIGAASGHVDSAAARLSNLLLVILAPPALVVGIVRSLRARNQVTVEAVFGVLALYILLGMFFAFIFGAIGRLTGTFFAQGEPVTTARCLYFSFTTLTTVGYGDLTAATNLGHTLSVTEALTGQIYLVTVVSLIVGNLRRAPRNDR
jgi:Ion channel